MDSEKRTLTVIRSSTVIDELDSIWRWNAERYSIDHADDYVGFLKQSISELSTEYARGATVPACPGLRYILIKRRASGHGHVVVYEFNADQVHVLHIFHTAQDWRNDVKDET